MSNDGSQTLRALWDLNPNWMLTLWARNFNTVTHREGSNQRRLSVHACLQPALESPHDSRVYSNEGVDFEILFRKGFERYFADGLLPEEVYADDICCFAQNFSRSSSGALYVLHQQGGDPDTAVVNVMGYFRDGKDARKVYLKGIEDLIDTQTRFAKFVGEVKPALALAVSYLADDTHWASFEEAGELYIGGELLPQSTLEWFRLLGQDGVREFLGMAEARLNLLFPEFAQLPPFAASRHLP